MIRKKRIAIIGTGYVGLSFAAILANVGYRVYALDIDKKKIETIQTGKSPFAEEGMNELLKRAIKKNLLIPTTSYEKYLPEADIVFSCVGTPDLPDGSANLSYVFDVAKIVANTCKNGVVFVQKSTIPVGTGREIMEIIKEENPKLAYDYVSNPEFLAEGSAIYDTFMTDRIVLGGDNEKALDYVLGLYKSVEEEAKSINLDKVSNYAHTYKTKDENRASFSIVKTSLESAELIKVVSNAFLSLKISFANSIALLCDKTGADINEVMDGVGMDKRIGRSFLYAGRGYGGGCFPKDVSGLIKVAEKKGIDLEIMKSSVCVNEHMTLEIINKIKNKVGSLKDKKISLLGLSFKPGTSDTRKSPAIKLANLFIKEGSFVIAFDPKALEEAKKELKGKVIYAQSIEDAISDTDIVVIATEWPEFINFEYGKHINKIKDKIIVDCQNRLEKENLKSLGFYYIGVGRS